MEILGYIIPKDLQKLSFVKSIHEQYQKKGRLSLKQQIAIEGILEIVPDFFDWEYVPTTTDEYIIDCWEQLIAKLKRNKFRKAKTKLTCIRALETIISEEPDMAVIADALGLNFNPRWRY